MFTVPCKPVGEARKIRVLVLDILSLSFPLDYKVEIE